MNSAYKNTLVEKGLIKETFPFVKRGELPEFDTISGKFKSSGYQNNINVTNLDYKLALNNYRTKFDLIFLDPPYKLDCCNEIIFAIENKDLLTPDGLIVCEVDSNTIINETDNFEICKETYKNITSIVGYCLEVVTLSCQRIQIPGVG
mgnify:CR=1 FL=1